VKEYKKDKAKTVTFKSISILSSIGGIAASSITLNPVGIAFAALSVVRNAVQLSTEIYRLSISAMKFGLELDKDITKVLVNRWKKAVKGSSEQHREGAREVGQALAVALVGHGGVEPKNCETRLEQYKQKLEALQVRAQEMGPRVYTVLDNAENTKKKLLQALAEDDHKKESQYKKVQKVIEQSIEHLLTSIEDKMQWARYGLLPEGVKDLDKRPTVEEEIKALEKHGDKIPINYYDLKVVLEEIKGKSPSWAKIAKRIVPIVGFANLASGSMVHGDTLEIAIKLLDDGIFDLAKVGATVLEEFVGEAKGALTGPEAMELSGEGGEMVSSMVEILKELKEMHVLDTLPENF
jgi:hypothetical protein